jgi:ATP-binding cassette subfamily C protein LapB
LINRVIVIDEGRIVADGPRDQVLAALARGKISVATN